MSAERSMIERVARAIDPEAWEPVDLLSIPARIAAEIEEHRKDKRALSTSIARDVLAAMREPTKTMVDVCMEPSGTTYPSSANREAHKRDWRAMIDAAAKERA